MSCCNLHQSDIESFFLCNGNETQEIVKPSGAHDFRFQRFIGMVCTRKLGISGWCKLQSIQKNIMWILECSHISLK